MRRRGVLKAHEGEPGAGARRWPARACGPGRRGRRLDGARVWVSPSARNRRCQGAPAVGGWLECSGRVLVTSDWQRCVPAGVVGGGHAPAPPSLHHGLLDFGGFAFPPVSLGPAGDCPCKD